MTDVSISWMSAKDKLFSEIDFFDVERLIGWLQNFEVIKNTIQVTSINKLPKINGSALIIDKSMASSSYLKQLSALKSYKGTIFCCDRSLYSVIPYRLPDYVVNVDVSPLCWSFFDHPDVKEKMIKIKAVFPVTANPLTVRLWGGPRYFFTPFFGAISKTMATQTQTMIIPTGGQVASTAYIIACNLGAKNIGLFGITHAYDNMAESEYPLHQQYHERVEGRYGVCFQDPIYEHYNVEYLKFIAAAKGRGVTTINTSKSGLLYSDDVVDLSLEEFVEKYA